jgi:hypothetical protein
VREEENGNKSAFNLNLPVLLNGKIYWYVCPRSLGAGVDKRLTEIEASRRKLGRQQHPATLNGSNLAFWGTT